MSNGLFVFAKQTNQDGSEEKTNDLFIRHDSTTTNSGLSFGDETGNTPLRILFEKDHGASIKTNDTLTLDAKHVSINQLENASTTDTENYNYVVMDSSGNLRKGERYFITINNTIDIILAHLETIDTSLQDILLSITTNQQLLNDRINIVAEDLLRTKNYTTLLNSTISTNKKDSDDKYKTVQTIVICIIAFLFIACIILIIILYRFHKKLSPHKDDLVIRIK